MKEKHSQTSEGDPQGDWQKEFADQQNPDVALLAAKLEAVPCGSEAGAEDEEESE